MINQFGTLEPFNMLSSPLVKLLFARRAASIENAAEAERKMQIIRALPLSLQI